MRTILFLTMLTATQWLSAQQGGDAAIRYFDFFNSAHTALSAKNMEYLQYAVHSEEVAVIAEKRLALLDQINTTRQQVAALPAFEGDAGLKAAMLKVLDTYQELFEVSFEEVEILKSNAQQSFDKMEAYIKAQTDAENRMATAANAFVKAQRQFATANQISLVEDTDQSEYDQLNALNQYQRSLFLGHFRVNKANSEFIAALEKNDAESMKAARVAITKACTEALPRMKSMADFNGNTAYRDAVVQQATILDALARQEYIALIRGTEKGNNLTTEEADAYNSAVEKINTELNPALESVQQTLMELLRANVPKPASRAVKQI
ncbi:MAG: hypothetical protein R2795_12480 [Saprospiraceae bacterium]